MTRGIPDLIHKLTKCCFENQLNLSIQTITDEKGVNKVERTDDAINLTLYSSDEDDVALAKEIELLLYSFKVSP